MQLTCSIFREGYRTKMFYCTEMYSMAMKCSLSAEVTCSTSSCTYFLLCFSCKISFFLAGVEGIKCFTLCIFC